MYFLDTNTCIYYLKGTYPPLRRRLLSHRPSDIGIPSLVKGELLYGAFKSERKERNLLLIEEFLQSFPVAEFGNAEAAHYARIRSGLEGQGRPIGPIDLVIAATVMANEGILITHNISEFSRIPDLEIEDWTNDNLPA